MHELALCGSIAGIVTRHAQGRRVSTVRLRVGRLRQVVPETLGYCWDLVSESTELDGSTLMIEVVAARLSCDDCTAEHEMGDIPAFVCPVCGGSRLTVLSGDEFSVASIDVAPSAVAR